MSLIDTDWSADWIRRQKEHGRPDDAAYWDRRARHFTPTADTSSYAAAFIQHMRLSGGESVLDVGSGSGALSLPLARQKHHVCAVDFSQGMLARLRQQAALEDLHNITMIQASWEDDWRAAGVPVADVAVSSRSIAVMDLGSALRKLDAHARRRVCLTVATHAFPVDLIAHEAVGRKLREHYEYIYCLNILFQMGIRPEVGFIRNEWESAFAGPEEARQSLRSMIAPTDEREEELLARFLDEHLVRTTDENGDIVWKQDRDYAVEWAFLAWDKAGTARTR